MNPDPSLPRENAPSADPAGEAQQLDARLEALLFSSEVPLSAERLAQLTGARRGDVVAAVDRLNVFYGESSRAFRISPLAGGFQLVTLSEHASLLAALHKDGVPTRLSRAALETLSIVAFKQPVTRAEVDAIRGVSASDRVLRHLLERKLVRISGRAQTPGRPLLYTKTREFLAYFGLSALADLPRSDELDALLAGAEGDADAEQEDAAAEAVPAVAGGNGGEAESADEWRDEGMEDVMSHSGEESDGREGSPEA